MRYGRADYDSLGVEAIPGGLARSHGDAEERAAADLRYRRPDNVLRLEGLVAIAMRWIARTAKSR